MFQTTTLPLCESHCLGVRRQCLDCVYRLKGQKAARPSVSAAGQVPGTAYKVATKPGVPAVGQACEKGLPNPANNKIQQHKQPRLGTLAGTDRKGD